MSDGYEALLDSVYESMPKRTESGERFETPVAKTFIQGSKTIVENFDFLCQKLRRTPRQLSKYLFNELAAPGEVTGRTLTLQGKVNNRLVNEKLAVYVKQCVMCSECNRPDTRIEEQGRGVSLLVCEACGARKPLRI
ncbi:MAG: translation initiation factor IF-2 subunit beta [Candidatus Micrarchaeia archaeon]